MKSGDEESEEDNAANKGRDLNKLFSGKGGEESGSDGENSDASEDFQSKMTKQQRKKYKK